MTDQVPTIDEIDSAEKLSEHLKSQPSLLSRIIAARNGLRAFPVFLNSLDSYPLSARQKKILFNSTFHAVLIFLAFCEDAKFDVKLSVSTAIRNLKDSEKLLLKRSPALHSMLRSLDAIANPDSAHFFVGRSIHSLSQEKLLSSKDIIFQESLND
ncbi:hypothetical protein GOZ81_16930, partial [Agrobacterium vitis]|uniref:hypothetical protein n=1 Tax=Agrobacterium vitis TaxID=373 RepID=UPI0012E8F927